MRGVVDELPEPRIGPQLFIIYDALKAVPCNVFCVFIICLDFQRNDAFIVEISAALFQKLLGVRKMRLGQHRVFHLIRIRWQQNIVVGFLPVDVAPFGECMVRNLDDFTRSVPFFTGLVTDDVFADSMNVITCYDTPMLDVGSKV